VTDSMTCVGCYRFGGTRWRQQRFRSRICLSVTCI